MKPHAIADKVKTSPRRVRPRKANISSEQRELRQRVMERQTSLEAERARRMEVTPRPASQPMLDIINGCLTALATILPSGAKTISEVTSTELSHWLDESPSVAVSEGARSDTA